MTFTEAKLQRTILSSIVDQCSAKLYSIKSNKTSPEYIAARKDFDKAFADLQEHSKIYIAAGKLLFKKDSK